MSNAFAPIVRARPDPIFGRPVHPGSPPIDYSPILLRIPFGFRIAPDTLSSEARRAAASGRSCLYPAFAFVPQETSPYLPLPSASEALPPLLDTALLIRAPEGLQPSRSGRCPAHTMAGSDFSRPCIIGFGSSPSRCGPRPLVTARPSARSPGSRTRSVRACQGLRPRRVGPPLAMSRRAVLPSTQLTVSAPGTLDLRGSMAGLHVPLPTLHLCPRGQRCTARGRRGSLLLRRIGLAPTTPCRSPGALTAHPRFRGYAGNSA